MAVSKANEVKPMAPAESAFVRHKITGISPCCPGMMFGERGIGLSSEIEVRKKIKELRQMLQELTKNKELTDSEVIAASQMLDVVLNEYYRILKRKRK